MSTFTFQWTKLFYYYNLEKNFNTSINRPCQNRNEKNPVKQNSDKRFQIRVFLNWRERFFGRMFYCMNTKKRCETYCCVKGQVATLEHLQKTKEKEWIQTQTLSNRVFFSPVADTRSKPAINLNLCHQIEAITNFKEVRKRPKVALSESRCLIYDSELKVEGKDATRLIGFSFVRKT